MPYFDSVRADPIQLEPYSKQELHASKQESESFKKQYFKDIFDEESLSRFSLRVSQNAHIEMFDKESLIEQARKQLLLNKQKILLNEIESEFSYEKLQNTVFEVRELIYFEYSEELSNLFLDSKFLLEKFELIERQILESKREDMFSNLKAKENRHKNQTRNVERQRSELETRDFERIMSLKPEQREQELVKLPESRFQKTRAQIQMALEEERQEEEDLKKKLKIFQRSSLRLQAWKKEKTA